LKRYGNLYHKIYDIENIKLAHKNAKKGKSYYKEVIKIDKNSEKYFAVIQELLAAKTFKTSNYQIIKKITDNGKEREIYKLPYFPDRIVHHCIMQVVGPIWYKTLIRDTYSSIKGRGIHDGVRRLKKALNDKENTIYCLKMDIEKFYPSVNNKIMKGIIRRKLKDKNLLWLLDEIIDSTKGLPIGNYLSQYLGNLYLSGYDHWIKEVKRVKYYFRYCDDMVILGKSKKWLHKLRIDTKKYLNENLRLILKNNWQIFPIDKRGIDFLGYRFFHDFILLRKSIKKKLVKRINFIRQNWYRLKPESIVNSIMSYYGWLKYANCKNLMTKYLDDEIFWIMKQTCKKYGISNPLQGMR